MTQKQRDAEIARLRGQLATGKFTVKEIASIRGKIGGLSGKGSPGRIRGGIAGSSKRWSKDASKIRKAK